MSTNETLQATKSKLYAMRAIVEELEMWESTISLLPTISFPSSWKIKILPPFRGALCRFYVYQGDVMVSVYLDFYDRLGIEEQPYWELYPSSTNADTARFHLNETEQLLDAIQTALDSLQVAANKAKYEHKN